ncbi:GntR family transcriptional regulator [Mariniflexile sp. HNIBRBA6329]|uniref:GntR family transcriptional regulator n=1 Tax=Mariniflexile sp. HNIBRBA6329 TaxID=3373088 RepID=UPI0037461966
MQINIKDGISSPIYLQIVNEIIENTSSGKLKMGEKMLSINKFSEKYKLSRDTVEKAYNILKKKKVIIGIKGKGTYVNNLKLIDKTNILFLINTSNPYKTKVYSSFVKSLNENYQINLFIFNNNEPFVFDTLIGSLNKYDYCIIMPHSKSTYTENLKYQYSLNDIVDRIPNEKLIILDNNDYKTEDCFFQIYQDNIHDFFNILKFSKLQISKYKRLHFIAQLETDYSNYTDYSAILFELQKYCSNNNLHLKVSDNASSNTDINLGDLFVIFEENDLVKLLNLIKTKKLSIGKDIGIISYNDTTLKRYLNITVISPNYNKMGEMAAEMIVNKTRGKLKNPYTFINRYSL